MNLNTVSDTILDETSSLDELRSALDAFVLECSGITGIRPDVSFDAWADDSLLATGVAINPQAAAHCALDYRRSVAFIRGTYAAINELKLQFPNVPLEVLYAGCGPFATLLLPLLSKFVPGELKLHLLDFHQSSLDSVNRLLAHFDFHDHDIQTIKDDASTYQHPGNLHLIIAETMQKSLEQEPQFAVTANLVPQLWSAGLFIPQRIDVSLCLADLEREKFLVGEALKNEGSDLKMEPLRYPIATVCTLLPDRASDLVHLAEQNATGNTPQLEPKMITIPMEPDLTRLDAALFTRIQVFGQYCLMDYESQITLPLKCHELLPLSGGDRWRVSYQLGSYPKFQFQHLNKI
jgi:hypothetical protein